MIPFFLALACLAPAGLTAAGAAAVSSATAPVRAQPLRLSLKEATEMAIKNNVTARLARAQTLSAKGRVLIAASRLLPNISGSVSETRRRTNLYAQGFYLLSGNFHGVSFPKLLGPFNVFDARVSLVQSILDMSSWEKTKSSRSDEKAFDMAERLTEQQVEMAAALAYIEDLRALKAIDTARADLVLSESLLKLANDKYDAGAAASIDVTRARNQEAQARLRLMNAKMVQDEDDLKLEHLCGLPMGRPLLLSDLLEFKPSSAPAAAIAVQNAMQERLEIVISKSRVESSLYALKAAYYEHVPVIQFAGDYGLLGNNPAGPIQNTLQTYQYGVNLTVPVFAGGRLFGDAKQARSDLIAQRAQYDDAQLKVEEDVRTAIDEFTTASDSVQTARISLGLAFDEMKLAQNRYRAGAADNIEVINAQTGLAQAEDRDVSSLASHNMARVNLSQALGRIEKFKF